jgi:hypothetical protein
MLTEHHTDESIYYLVGDHPASISRGFPNNDARKTFCFRLYQFLCWTSHLSFIALIIFSIESNRGAFVEHSTIRPNCGCMKTDGFVSVNSTLCCLQLVPSYCVPAPSSVDSWVDVPFIVVPWLLWVHVFIPLIKLFRRIDYFLANKWLTGIVFIFIHAGEFGLSCGLLVRFGLDWTTDTQCIV